MVKNEELGLFLTDFWNIGGGFEVGYLNSFDELWVSLGFGLPDRKNIKLGWARSSAEDAFSVRCETFGFKSWSRWQWSNSSFPTCLKKYIVLVRFLGIKKFVFLRWKQDRTRLFCC